MTSRPGAPPGIAEARRGGGGLGVEKAPDGERDAASVPPSTVESWQRHERHRDQLVIRRLRRSIPREGGGVLGLYPDPTADEAEFERLGREFAAQFSRYRAPAAGAGAS